MSETAMMALPHGVLLGATSLDVLAAAGARCADIRMRQQARLARLLYAVAQGSALYTRHLRRLSQDPFVQLRQLPIIGKAELMARFGEWVTDPDITLDGLRAFTADATRMGTPYLGRYVVWESSGSSGQPAIFVQDAHSMAINDALESLRRCPIQPGAGAVEEGRWSPRVAFVGVTSGHFASAVQMRRVQALYPWAVQALRSISILQPMAQVVDALNAFAPTIVATYPSVAVALAGQREAGALAITPHAVWTGGETLSAAARARVKRQLHCDVRDHYGASEFLSIASECACGHLHANTDWLILEPVDEKFHAVPPGHRSATTLLTHLGNRVQPILRYDIGDQITLSNRSCACGSPLPVIDVIGRSDPALVMQGNTGMPAQLLPMALTTLLEEEAGLYEFQLYQRDGHSLELRVPHKGGAAQAALKRGAHSLQRYAAQQGVAALQVITREGQTLQRGRSGKVLRIMAHASAAG